jgi:hypothetical protein
MSAGLFPNLFLSSLKCSGFINAGSMMKKEKSPLVYYSFFLYFLGRKYIE